MQRVTKRTDEFRPRLYGIAAAGPESSVWPSARGVCIYFHVARTTRAPWVAPEWARYKREFLAASARGRGARLYGYLWERGGVIK